ncbi:MAG: hypothetical protein AB3K77_00050 [Methanosarcinaceae archaeon]
MSDTETPTYEINISLENLSELFFELYANPPKNDNKDYLKSSISIKRSSINPLIHSDIMGCQTVYKLKLI